MAQRCKLKQSNALKHGVYSTIGLLPGESPAKLKKHQKDVIDEFRPNGPVEHDIVMTMARALWRKQNLATFQTAQLVKFRHEFHPRDFLEGSTQASKAEDIGGDLQAICRGVSPLGEDDAGRAPARATRDRSSLERLGPGASRR